MPESIWAVVVSERPTANFERALTRGGSVAGVPELFADGGYHLLLIESSLASHATQHTIS
jgi:hypothetical protein